MEIKKLIEICEKSVECDPWVKERGLLGYASEIKDEVEEMIFEVKAKDYEKLKDELGDVLMDWLQLVVLAEGEGHFKKEDIIQNTMNKWTRRKPYLENNQKVTKEEARKFWKEAKEKEKLIQK